MSFTVAALYHFAELDVLEEKQGSLLDLCREEKVRGTILLAAEGVNGTICGMAEGIQAVVDRIKSWQGFSGLDVKYSNSTDMCFNRMKVKVKREIVTMGMPDIDPEREAGVYIDPKEWNSVIQRDDVMVIDTRNSFEFEVGRFRNAIDPGTVSFHEFPEWADNLAAQPDRPQAVAMYCTGGIRCEKATSYMKRIGFSEVFHLKGGILKYLEEVPEDESLWDGECFVFDGRVSLKHGLDEGEAELCYGCRHPLSHADRESPKFEEGVSCPRCHDAIPDDDKERYRERQHQIKLAMERGQQHIRDDATESAAVQTR